MGFWLIQRGTFNELKEYGNITGDRDQGLIDLDYMGYAEFEYNAIPYAFRRIMQNKEDYIFHYCNDIRDANGKILVLYCNRNNADAIVTEIKKYLSKRYQLKSFCLLPECIKEKEYADRKQAFWCIDNSDIGNWIGWFGMDKVTPFRKTIDKVYTEWWLPKSDEEKERDYN